MNDLPPFVKKYVSTTYYNQLTWNERAAYLRGIQDVMNVFSKDLENRAMQVLQRKAHWLEPRGSATIPVEYLSSQRTTATVTSTPTPSQQTAAKSTAAVKTVTAGVTTAAIATLNGAAAKAAQAARVPQLSQPSQPSQHSQPSQPSQYSQPSQHSTQSSQLLKGTQSSSQLFQRLPHSTTSQPHLKRKVTEAAPIDTEITFVGMKYRSGHVFSPSDQVRLERDHKNPVDKNAIKVMVFKNGNWIHAAYVGRDDASSLKDQIGIEHMRLTYLRAYLASVKYRLQA
ncbi:hypothetical protein EC991_000548 [Linnemannia zychae]|nr:hypothetical protein EC991_000548 [Linnemannia zychae]